MTFSQFVHSGFHLLWNPLLISTLDSANTGGALAQGQQGRIYGVVIPALLVTLAYNAWARGTKQPQSHRWFGSSILALFMVTVLWLVIKPTVLADFDATYYFAGRLIIEAPETLYRWETYLDPDVFAIGFVNIPIVALLFTPFSYLPLPLAQFTFTALGLLATLAIYELLEAITHPTGWRRIALLITIATSGPLYYSLRLGNTTHFLLLVLIAVWLSLHTGAAVRSGALLAGMVIIKPPLLALGLFFLLRRQWNVLVGLCATLGSVAIASLLLFGFDLHREWYVTSIQPFSGKPLAAFNVQSVDGFLARLLTDADPISWLSIEVDWSYRLIRYIVLSLLVGLVLWVCWKSPRSQSTIETNLEFSIFLCLTLLISPISWNHYYLLLLLPIALLLGQQLGVPQSKSYLLLTGLSIALMAPLPLAAFIKVLHFKILYSHCFYGGLLLLALMLKARWNQARHPVSTNSSTQIA